MNYLPAHKPILFPNFKSNTFLALERETEVWRPEKSQIARYTGRNVPTQRREHWLDRLSGSCYTLIQWKFFRNSSDAGAAAASRKRKATSAFALGKKRLGTVKITETWTCTYLLYSIIWNQITLESQFIFGPISKGTNAADSLIYIVLIIIQDLNGATFQSAYRLSRITNYL